MPDTRPEEVGPDEVDWRALLESVHTWKRLAMKYEVDLEETLVLLGKALTEVLSLRGELRGLGVHRYNSLGHDINSLVDRCLRSRPNMKKRVQKRYDEMRLVPPPEKKES